jgi:hypothetical protein
MVMPNPAPTTKEPHVDTLVPTTAPSAANPRCGCTDPASIDRDRDGAVTDALTHMTTAATYAAAAIHRNCFYSAEHAVDALTETAAAAIVVASHLGGYVTDLWPDAGPTIEHSYRLLLPGTTLERITWVNRVARPSPISWRSSIACRKFQTGR